MRTPSTRTFLSYFTPLCFLVLLWKPMPTLADCIRNSRIEFLANDYKKNYFIDEITKQFQNCKNSITNYANEDLDISVPIVLLQFTSIFPNSLNVYPIEVTRVAFSSPENFENFKRNSSQISQNYVQILKKINVHPQTCKLNIALFPPSPYRDGRLYRGNFLKEPSWLLFEFNEYQAGTWQIDTTPIFKIAIIRNQPKLSTIVHAWSSSVRINTYLALLHKYMLVLTTCLFRNTFEEHVVQFEERVINAYFHCPFCGTCDPLVSIYSETTDLAGIFNFGHALETALSLADNGGAQLWDYSSHTYLNYLMRVAIQTIGLKNSRDSLIKGFKFEMDKLYRFTLGRELDSHLIVGIVGNGSIMVHENVLNAHRHRVFADPTCGFQKVMHPYDIPKIIVQPSNNLMAYQSMDLITSFEAYKFVTCHREVTSFFSPLLETVTPFDLGTLLSILASLVVCCVIAHYGGYFSKYFGNQVAKISKVQKSALSFRIVCGLLDQSNNYLASLPSNSIIEFIALFSIPICFQIISNEYKGDNIYRLTRSPPLIPFDTFDALVQHNFTLYSGPVKLGRYFWMTYFDVISVTPKKLMAAFGSNHVKLRDTAEQTVFSSLLKDIYISGGDQIFKYSTSEFYASLPKLVKRYLNQTALFLNWGQVSEAEKGFIERESVELLYVHHMFQCNKSAVIVNAQMALLIFSNMSQYSLPVYLGSEVFPSYDGYFLSGSVPSKAFKRIKGLATSGIYQNWKKFVSDLIIRTGWKYQLDNNIAGKNQHKSMSVLVVFIPIFSSVAAAIMFLVELKMHAFRTNTCYKAFQKLSRIVFLRNTYRISCTVWFLKTLKAHLCKYISPVVYLRKYLKILCQ